MRPARDIAFIFLGNLKGLRPTPYRSGSGNFSTCSRLTLESDSIHACVSDEAHSRVAGTKEEVTAPHPYKETAEITLMASASRL
jgi:hypothetical protein